MIEAINLKKNYVTAAGMLTALAGASLHVKAGEFVAVMGPSGSGKSTLMNVLGCLDRPTEGQYILNGCNVGNLEDGELSELRCSLIGFVFQSFNLLPRLTILANVMLPMRYAGLSRARCERRAMQLLQQLGLNTKANLRPMQLSGGQQQRVAIARALANEPKVIFADEPTGNLDSRTGLEILQWFTRLNCEQGVTVVLVTHDGRAASFAHRLVRVVDGVIAYDGPAPTQREWSP